MTLEMRFAEPLWLVGLLLPLIYILLLKLYRQQQIQKLIDPKLLPWLVHTNSATVQGGRGSFRAVLSGFARKWPLFSFLAAYFCLLIALAGPRTEVLQNKTTAETRTEAPAQVVMALDLSQSMLVTDVQVSGDRMSRFHLGQSLMLSLAGLLNPKQVVLGLMGFEAAAHMVLPVTSDFDLWSHYVGLIQPQMMPTQGSGIESAIILGVQKIEQAPRSSNHLLIWTDGRPADQPIDARIKADFTLAISKIEQLGIQVSVIGLGGSRLSAVPDESHASGQLHVHGLPIQSRLESSSLQRLAQQLGGNYYQASSDLSFLKSLSEEVIKENTDHTTQQKIWQDQSLAWVVMAFVFLLLAVLPVRISSAQPLLLLLLLNFPSEDSYASEQMAYDALMSKDYAMAVAGYEQLDHFVGWLGAGAASYRQEDYLSAIAYFRQAFLKAAQDPQRGQALFNLGNTYLKSNQIELAIEAYQNALLYRPKHSATEKNLALALERLKQEILPKKQGEGEEGSSGKGDDFAFYGGQKANPDGKGVGEESEGEGESVFVLPNQPEVDNPPVAKLYLHQLSANTDRTQLQRALHLQQVKAEFEVKLKQIEGKQLQLLQRLFEREEGFQAAQTKRHQVPGVKPW